MWYEEDDIEYSEENAIFDDEFQELMHIGVLERSGRYPWGSGENPYQRLHNAFGEWNKLKSQGLNDDEIAKLWGISTAKLKARNNYYIQNLKNERFTQVRELYSQGVPKLQIGKKLGIDEATVRKYLKGVEGRHGQIMLATTDMLRNELSRPGYLDVGRGTEARLGVSGTYLKQAISQMEDEGYIYMNNLKIKQGGTGNYVHTKIIFPPELIGVDRQTVIDAYDTQTENPEAIKALRRRATGYCLKNLTQMNYVNAHSENGGESYEKPENPINIKASRVAIRYADDPDFSGQLMDGVIEIRRGVPDLDLGKAHYAQVRIGVDAGKDGLLYAKGMAVYADDLPPGVDIRVNSNKLKSQGIKKALKPQNTKVLQDENGKDVLDKDGNPVRVIDEENPFSASIKSEGDLEARKMVQRHYIDEKGNKKLSALNIVNEEGSWGDWTKSLPSQFLSKQTPQLAKQQLDLDIKKREKDFSDLMELTNPVLRQQLLEDFAKKCDKAAVNLKAAALPRQATRVIIPETSLKENEIYAPQFEPGEEVILVRYPHGGIFEIPRLTVNNKNKAAAKRIGSDNRDAVCINPKTASVLSGADFDGDTVVVIPTKNITIKSRAPLEGLKGFDTNVYAVSEEDKKSGAVSIMKTDKQRNTQMGIISNLITDMTVGGNATDDELERAVRHSMVVIDALKHELDYKRSERDNRINELKVKYQNGGGASTIISRAKKEIEVPTRREKIDPATGEIIFVPKNETKMARKKVMESYTEYYTDPVTGKERHRTKKREKIDPETGRTVWEDKGIETKTTKSTMMFEERNDAYNLTSGGSKEHPGTKMESIYADYANHMKAMANRARKEAITTTIDKRNPTARKAFAEETASLQRKVNEAQANAPMERKANAIAQAMVRMIKQDRPLSLAEESKEMAKQTKRARQYIGAARKEVEITDKEWEAIQAGAVSKTLQRQIYRFADNDKLMERAMPRERKALDPSLVAAMKSMLARGYTSQEVADRFNISTSTVFQYVDSQ